MPPDTKKHLFDIRRAAERLVRFSAGRSADDYASDDFLRSAVERQFEIVGEAIGRIVRSGDVATAARISEYRRIIGFRNQLIHAYDLIDDQTVWKTLQTKLPVLLAEVTAMLAEPEDDPVQPAEQQPPSPSGEQA